MFSYLFGKLADSSDLHGTTLDRKFHKIVALLNEVAYQGQGSVTRHSDSSFQLYQQGKNQIILFSYKNRSLSITWKYKFFQREMIFERTLVDAHSMDEKAQTFVAQKLIEEMGERVMRHQQVVMGK